ncbi:hypothetical protein [Fluviicola sp.]|uniref:hypothetical protein n=1 Tax=Fluviicola sp. TaxID=1917219 RepID=UPI00261A2EB5|nr:hypothetical protein [Fluviicola sp.]
MSPEEICSILRIEDLSEAADALEMELFELKKSVLAKPLLRQTLKSKILRLEKLSQVTASLNFPEGQVSFEYDLLQTDNVLELWGGYMKAKSHWKRLFAQSTTPESAIVLLEQGLKMELAFSEQFSASDWIEEDPVFGVEPDPMLIQNGLKQASERGFLRFEDLEKNKSELQKELLLAIKRLSLLPKYLR